MRLILSVASFLLISLMIFNGYMASTDQNTDVSSLELQGLSSSGDFIRVAEEGNSLPRQ